MNKSTRIALPLKICDGTWTGGQQCRYFDENHIWCLKLTKYKEIIDKEVALYYKDSLAVDSGMPIGDNCPGCPAPLDIMIEASVN